MIKKVLELVKINVLPFETNKLIIRICLKLIHCCEQTHCRHLDTVFFWIGSKNLCGASCTTADAKF